MQWERFVFVNYKQRYYPFDTVQHKFFWNKDWIMHCLFVVCWTENQVMWYKGEACMLVV